MNDRSQGAAVAFWVVVADSARARIFTAKSRVAALEELESFVHPEGRASERDLVSDRRGRAVQGASTRRAAMSGEVDPKQHEAMMFAKQIASRLDQGRVRGEYARLVVVAAPAFLGLLRERLDRQVLDRVTQTVDKDLTQLRPDEVRARLPEMLG